MPRCPYCREEIDNLYYCCDTQGTEYGNVDFSLEDYECNDSQQDDCNNFRHYCPSCDHELSNNEIRHLGLVAEGSESDEDEDEDDDEPAATLAEDTDYLAHQRAQNTRFNRVSFQLTTTVVFCSKCHELKMSNQVNEEGTCTSCQETA